MQIKNPHGAIINMYDNHSVKIDKLNKLIKTLFHICKLTKYELTIP